MSRGMGCFLGQNCANDLCHTGNYAYRTLGGRYQVNFKEKKTMHNLSFCEISKTQGDKLEKLGQLFQVTIHCHPGHLQPKTLLGH